MVDFDEILAAAIRTAWLQVNGPEPRLPYQIEAETVRRIRAALESEGINMRWFDFLAASIFIGVTVLLLGGTAMSVRQRTADIYLAEAQPRVAAQQ